ncbi:MAG: hypothetical protein HYX28_01210 [Candidatus Koribacter versatilis]|uniref:Glycosyl hydrolase family 71 n=1 Tax=Candidatus Korobacter versatilis TaxID=658062 RepID=A0A932A8B0_9BACT|nr:hypothetical protein [Candidatus Koribacter versatilis]
MKTSYSVLPPGLRVLLFSLLSLAVAGCSAHRDIHQTLRSNFQAPEGSPMLLAAYQPWFGRPGHINVGYSSQDRVVLANQITKAKALGIGGFVVNWYGPRKDFEDRSYSLLQQLAAENDFKVALMYDEPDDRPGDVTDDTIRDLQFGYEHYIAQNASVPSAAYLRYNGHPVIFIFPKSGNTDWKRVREAMASWPEQPLLLYRDINQRYAAAFDGFYAWVKPSGSWSADGSDWGRDYLESFYSKMKSKYPDKLAVGAAWPGFDDSRASWSKNRRMDARCGKTFQDSLHLFRRYYNDRERLPFLMIVTWNDYEEGTAIEKGLASCSG